jgi:transcriptional regulator with GAF, ATPase, and Fis domain
VGTYNFTIVLRHLFKFASFLLIYKAILDIGLMDPYRFLFQNLQKSQEEYRQAQKELQQRIRDDLIEAYKYIGFSNRKMSILMEVENHSNHKKNRKELIAYIANVAKSACHASVALIYRHEKNGTFKMVLGEGLKKNNMDDLERVDAKKAEFVKNMIKEKKVMNSSCEFFDPGCFNGNGKLSYFVAAPFMVENACKGFLFLGFEDKKSMVQQEIEFINIFSIHISSALAKLGVIK